MIYLGSWNVGSLTGKLRELVDTAIMRHINILCVQETKWTGQKAKDVENAGFKLWYTGKERSRNGVGILIDKSLKNKIIAVRRQGDMIIMIKLIFGDLVLNVISAYCQETIFGDFAPQVGLSDYVKRRFWKDLEDIVRGVSISEKLFIGGDLNGHIGIFRGGFERVHEGFGYGEQNQEGEDILNFAIAYDLMIANTFFRMEKSHLITFNSGQYSSQIDFILTRREERPNCMDYKVIPGECVVTQHKLLVAEFYFQVCVRRDRGMKITRMRWWKLKWDVSPVFMNRVIAYGLWNESEDANNMWKKMATHIRKVAIEVFGVTRGNKREPKDT
jgi:hypothetical protein